MGTASAFSRLVTGGPVWGTATSTESPSPRSSSKPRVAGGTGARYSSSAAGCASDPGTQGTEFRSAAGLRPPRSRSRACFCNDISICGQRLTAGRRLRRSSRLRVWNSVCCSATAARGEQPRHRRIALERASMSLLGRAVRKQHDTPGNKKQQCGGGRISAKGKPPGADRLIEKITNHRAERARDYKCRPE